MEIEINPNAAVDFLLKNANLFAKAKSERVYLEEFRKSKKALLMQEAFFAGVDTMAGQERDAYARQEYRDLLDGLKTAVEVEETLKWKMTAAQLRVEIWRSMEASNRTLDRTLK
jgi:hypothetical protein